MSCWREGNQAVNSKARRWESTSSQSHACWDKQEAGGKSGWSISRRGLGFWLWWEKPTSCSTMEIPCLIPRLCLSTLLWEVLSHCTASMKAWEMCPCRAGVAVLGSISAPLTQTIFITIILRAPTGLHGHDQPQRVPKHLLLGHLELLPTCSCAQPCLLVYGLDFPGGIPML